MPHLYLPDGRLATEDGELAFQFVRSGGPGGQNVNKVATKAELRWNVGQSRLPEEVKRRFRALYRTRINADGVLVIQSQRTRSQSHNAADCLARLREMLAVAATPPKVRKATRPSRSSVKRRLENKRKRSELKSSRRARYD